jgi:sterol desaturase/sphingolipid hydroxylase (fatty acid hydroxylase superfamily)
VAPKRERSVSRRRRWPNNLGVVLVDTLLARIVAPTGAVGFAVWAEARHWGLLHQTSWPGWIEFLVALLLLDLAIYLQHRLFHYVPVLWRLHRMHHADLDVDVTTGARFHPLEILLSLGIKFIAIVILGPPTLAVFLFEIALNATSMFNHSNVRIAPSLERCLRWLVVTPDMHRTHHSIVRRETDSNFGFNLPWWDRVFRTYRPQPEAGHQGMTIGIDRFRDPKELRLDRMLTQPFREDSDRTPWRK